MFALSGPEMAIFLLVIILYVAAAMVGIFQLRPAGRRYGRLLMPFVCLAIVLEAVILVFRAVAIKGVPLTGLFESMIVLTIVFGLMYLFFSIAIEQVWFGSVMVWVILAMILMAGTVAEPAAEPHAVAATPWAIAHGIAMILGGASVIFATASAFLYLLGTHRLKHKQVMQVLGRVPNIEKLQLLNLFGIRAGFVLITIGLISGLGLASLRLATLGISIIEWLTDAKVVCMAATWVLLAVVLLLHRLVLLKDRARAYVTIAAFVLVLFAILGVTVLGATRHDFAYHDLPVTSMVPKA
ncbi:MAG: cytochrome c biogenesis protein CcsA [Planctomycetota bacterium]|nr:MAG: cytochrome c biogenesis protein CcsA [Planctomycetota bacterium]